MQTQTEFPWTAFITWESEYIYLENIFLSKHFGIPLSWKMVQGQGKPRKVHSAHCTHKGDFFPAQTGHCDLATAKMKKKVAWWGGQKKINTEGLLCAYVRGVCLRHKKSGNPCHCIQRCPPPTLTLLFRETSSPLFHVT